MDDGRGIGGVGCFSIDSLCLLVSSSECSFDYQYIHDIILMPIAQSTIIPFPSMNEDYTSSLHKYY